LMNLIILFFPINHKVIGGVVQDYALMMNFRGIFKE